MRSHCDADHHNDTFARTRERSIQTLLPKMQNIIHSHVGSLSFFYYFFFLRTLKRYSYLTTQVCSSHKYNGKNDKEASPSKFSIDAGAPLLHSACNLLRKKKSVQVVVVLFLKQTFVHTVEAHRGRTRGWGKKVRDKQSEKERKNLKNFDVYVRYGTARYDRQDRELNRFIERR